MNSRQGVTLIELMVVIVVSTIIIGGAFSVYTGFYKSFFSSSRYTDSEQGTYRKIDMIGSTLRRAAAITVIHPNKITMETSDRDTFSILIRGDSLFRQEGDSMPKFWFTMDSCSVSSELQDSGWITATIRGGYPGKFKNVHTIHRSVTVFRKPVKVRDSQWGF